MRTVILLACASLILLIGGGWFAYSEFFAGPLAGIVVVIDSGHGGADPGSHGTYVDASGKSVAINEDEYVHDVACRLSHVVSGMGGTPVITVVDPGNRGCAPDSRPQNEGIPADKDEVFSSDGSGVTAGQGGLQKRVDIANKALADRWWRFWERVVYIAIHFDANANGQIEGVSFIAPEGDDRELTTYLVGAFDDANRLRTQSGVEHVPVVKSGDPSTGTIHVYVLSPKTNDVRQRILIELGNFKNPKDLWRIRDAAVRQSYADTIAKALAELNRLPAEKVRN